MASIPIPSDWGPYEEDPDLHNVYERFGGRSISEIQPLLKENFIMRCLDLSLMPERPFSYYADGFADYVVAGRYRNEETGFNVARLMDAIDSQFEDRPVPWLRFWTEHLPLLSQLETLVVELEPDADVREELSHRTGEIRRRLES